MFRNYLSAAWGDLARSPLQSFISVGGLAIGLTAMLVIGLMEFGFLNYDSFIQDHGRVHAFGKPGGVTRGLKELGLGDVR